jgi:hypothetical protein
MNCASYGWHANWRFTADFPSSPQRNSSRVQNVSTLFREFDAGLPCVEQPDRVFGRSRTQVHVALRRPVRRLELTDIAGLRMVASGRHCIFFEADQSRLLVEPEVARHHQSQKSG